MRIIRYVLPIILVSPSFHFAQTKPGQALIEVRAIVIDRTGRLIEDLGKDDFVMVADSAQQPISIFSVEKIGQGTDLQSAASPRNIILLVDTAGISDTGLVNVKKALAGFVQDQATSQDAIAVMTTAGKPGPAAELTKDRAKLQEAIKKLRAGGGRTDSFLTPALCGKVTKREAEAVTLAMRIIESEERTSGSVAMTENNPQAQAASRCMMLLMDAATKRKAAAAAIRAAAEKLAAVPGQRVIALFSDGFSMTAPGGEVAVADLRPAVSGAASQGTMIYTFDTHGALDTKPINMGSLTLTSQMNDSVRDYQHGFALLSSQTGGEAILNIDALGDQLKRMLDNNRVYYRLACAAPEDKDPRTYRPLAVSVKNHPDYRVRTQRGYAVADLPRVK